MTVDVWMPAIGQQELVDKAIYFLRGNSRDSSTGYVVIDNASQTEIKPERAVVVRNDENLGMVRSLQQAVENSSADIIVYLHSDMFVYEEGWDEQLVAAFDADPKLAALGVVGAVQADANGGRSGTVCAFRDGHLHGDKPKQKITPVALLDGCFMAFRRDILEHVPWDELEDNGYFFSYDKGLTLWLTMESYHVGVIDFDSEHLGGKTSCREEFNESLTKMGQNMSDMYWESERRYIERWKSCFPVRVRSDWHVDVGVR